MKAIQIKQYGGEDQLEMVEVSKPRAEAGQLVVRVQATSFNPIDPKRASGDMRQVFPLEFPFTPGGDFSGVIDSVGEGVTEFRVGDDVIGVLDGGRRLRRIYRRRRSESFTQTDKRESRRSCLPCTGRPDSGPDA
jgi:NADPH:quinone reductase-like Zn-dependent oxidoreductase